MISIVDLLFFGTLPVVSEFTTEIGHVVDHIFVTYEENGVVFPDIYNTNQVVFTLEPGVEDNDYFEFGQNTGFGIPLITKTRFDYETKNSYSVRVTATDQNSNSIQQSFLITVTDSHYDTNLPPTDFFFHELHPVIDNSQGLPSGRFVGNFNKSFYNNAKVIEADIDVVPENPYNYYHYSLVEGEGSDDNNNFTIAGGGVLWTSIHAVFNYAEKPQHSIRVRIQDPYGGSFEKVFIINVAANIVALTSQVVVITNSGTAIASIDVNPTLIPVTINGQGLPAGSVLRNTLTNQKFVKIEGTAMSFIPIEVEPKTSWGFTSTGNAIWEILQAL